MGSAMALLNVKVVPGASRSEVSGRYDDGIKLRVAAAPEAGRANREVIELLASALGLPAASLAIVRGHASPRKVVEIQGLDLSDVMTRLGLER